MWKPADWEEPKDELGRYVFGVDEKCAGATSSGSSTDKKGSNRSSRRNSPELTTSNSKGSRAGEKSTLYSGADSASMRGGHVSGTKSSAVRVACQLCEKTFYDKSTLNRHVSVVHEKQRSACPHCDKSLSNKTSLKQHVKVSPIIRESVQKY